MLRKKYRYFSTKPTNIFGRYFTIFLYLVKRFWKKFAQSKFASFVQQFHWISGQPDIRYNPNVHIFFPSRFSKTLALLQTRPKIRQQHFNNASDRTNTDADLIGYRTDIWLNKNVRFFIIKNRLHKIIFSFNRYPSALIFFFWFWNIWQHCGKCIYPDRPHKYCTAALGFHKHREKTLGIQSGDMNEGN